MRRIRKPATFGAMRLRPSSSRRNAFRKRIPRSWKYTQGLGYLGKAPDAVHLRPCDGGIMMPEGRDVFIQACTYMPKNVLYLLEKNGYTLDNLTYFIGHQANMRIMSNIAKQLNLPEEKFLHNIEELGNTGSVSSALVYAQNDHSFKKGDLVAITVFGGGYSTGACLIKC